jgi:hypothetical protein
MEIIKMSPFANHEAMRTPIFFKDRKPYIQALNGKESLEVVPEDPLEERGDYYLMTREGQRDKIMLDTRRVCFAKVIEPTQEVPGEQS